MKRLGFLIAIFLIITTIAWSAPTTDTSTLTWDAPTTNTDGSPLTDLGGYKIYSRTGATYADPGVDVGTSTTYQFTGMPEGDYFFVVIAYDTSGNESVYSNEVNRTINFSVLNPPSGVVVGP